MISNENRFKIQGIIEMVSKGACENYFESTLLRDACKLSDAEILGVILNIEIDFKITTNAVLGNMKYVRTVGDIYKIFSANYEEKKKIYRFQMY